MQVGGGWGGGGRVKTGQLSLFMLWLVTTIHAEPSYHCLPAQPKRWYW